ncbi:kinesin protein-domain-containing protein [Chiua virens]|nr:kinesin protein-domain-containing protein [Chiua virens]
MTSKHGSAPSTRPASPVPSLLSAGSKISFFLTIDSIKGLSSHDFAALHLQTVETSSLSGLKFRRTFSIVAPTKVINYLRQGYAPVEFFAAVKPTYLERLERWDEMREQRVHPRPTSPVSQTDSKTSNSSISNTQTMRRSETDFVVEQLHDVAARVQIRELGADGDYVPVPVVSQGSLDPGAFFLHQGLQRRVFLELSSDSGLQFPWSDATKVRLGNVRLLDPKGRIHDSTSKAMVTLPLLADQTVEFKPDGTGSLTAEALWDSSVHDSVLLNRVTTNPGQWRWSRAAEPVQFSMDVSVTMQTRDARPPNRFLTFLSSGKILSRMNSIFKVRLSPPLTRSPQDLWRLDTSEKYVRGEEVLQNWKPRGISVVQDYNRLVKTEKRAADVQAVRVVLASSRAMSRPPTSGSTVWASDTLLQKTIALWQKRFGHPDEIVLSQVPRETDKPTTSTSKVSRIHVDTVKLNSTVTHSTTEARLAVLPATLRG